MPRGSLRAVSGGTRIRYLALAAIAVVSALVLPGPAPREPSVAPDLPRPLDVQAPDAGPAPVGDEPSTIVAERGLERPAERVEKAATQTKATNVAAGAPALAPKTRQTIEILYSETHDESERPRAASSGACPNATTCTAHQLQRARWSTDSTGKLTLKWKYNDAGRRNLRAPEGLLESAIRSGMAEWHKWNSNVNFAYGGLTTATFGARGRDGTCDDGTNTIGWNKMDREIIAQVITCLDSSGRRVVDTDLALNVTQHWEDVQGAPESRHTFDIRSIVTHEIGHILSLADLYSNDALYMTMMGNARYGETRKRTLGLGDVIGVQNAYKCGSADSCPRKGIVND